MIISVEPKAFILNHPEYEIPATAEIIDPWLQDGELIGYRLRFAGEQFERHLRTSEIAALQKGVGGPGTEIQLSRQGSFYYYGRREFGVATVSDQPISRERALQIYSNNQVDEDNQTHVVGVVSFNGRACTWRWAITVNEED